MHIDKATSMFRQYSCSFKTFTRNRYNPARRQIHQLQASDTMIRLLCSLCNNERKEFPRIYFKNTRHQNQNKTELEFLPHFKSCSVFKSFLQINLSSILTNITNIDRLPSSNVFVPQYPRWFWTSCEICCVRNFNKVVSKF